MKKILFLAICSVALLFSACNIDNVEVAQPSDKVGRIMLNVAASGASFSTRAIGDAVADTSAESKLELVDVFIFTQGTDNASSTLFYHERIDHSVSAEPHTLGLDINTIVKGQAYYVDVVANSVALGGIDVDDMPTAIANRADLFSEIETTQYVHLTGLDVTSVDVPTSFMMDGIAYQGASEPATPSAVVLLPVSADTSDDVNLNVTLRRAAAKILYNFNIKSGSDAHFSSFGTKSGDNYVAMGSYYISNLKYKAHLLAEAEAVKSWTSADDYMRNTSEIPYGDMLSSVQSSVTSPIQTMQLVAYVYCHKWDYNQGASASVSEIEPSVIVNLPVVATNGEEYARNYYEVSLDVEPNNETVAGVTTSHFALERNHYYVINATINALGGDNPQTVVTLDDIEYEVYPWDEKVIEVGGNASAKYLTLNTYHFEMHNESVDDYSLKFASSSPIESVTLKEAYYYNKYGNRINLSGGDTTDRGVVNQIEATASADVLTGGITVTSPLKYNSADAHKNTIRYLTFEVENEQGEVKQFTVMQYPLVYITNQQGWYSYRLDFIAPGQSEPTTYQNISATNNIVSISYNRGTFSYTTNGNSTSNFWYSKVDTKYTPSYYAGEANIHSYYYRTNRVQTSSSTPGFNARMYHVRLTATSNDYTLAVPRLVNDTGAEDYGFTDSGADNAKLVSPSFMIASQLGVVQMNNIRYTSTNNSSIYLPEMKRVFGEHCRNYVETYTRTNSNGETETVHLDDWRLPTESELKIIIGLQGASGDNNSAIDYLMNAGFYYTASGPVFNSKHAHGGGVNANSNPVSYTSVRCVRDAFDSKTPSVITNASAQTE